MGSCESAEQEPDRREPEEGDGGAGEVVEVFGEPAAAPEPGEGALDDPAFGKDREASGVGALDDLDLPVGDGAERRGDPRALIGGIGDDVGEERKELACVFEKRWAAVAILHRGGMDIGVWHEAERVDDDVALGRASIPTPLRTA